tara:strand:- start:455 stop:1447 length:993 start_codon:yes stop_codon:yes gene_type:complete
MRTAGRLSLIFAAVLAISGVAAYFYGEHLYTKPGPLAADKRLVIEKGSGVGQVAALLHRQGIIDNPLVFRLGVRLDGRAEALKAGEFDFPATISMQQAAALIASGKTVLRRLTIAEGLTTRQILTLVEAAEGMTGTTNGQAVPEGSLLPETYFYSWGDTRSALVARMRSAMAAAMAELWPAREAGLSLRTPDEAVILASIIEKETGIAEERRRVSAVFHNRLKRGMRLQSDPTVVYGLSGGSGGLGRPLTRSDLATPSPYNSYLNHGLPPGPIANPGRAAIEAALNPDNSKDLYFVADGSGGHAFARTLQEHNRNVARFRRLQRLQKAKP